MCLGNLGKWSIITRKVILEKGRSDFFLFLFEFSQNDFLFVLINAPPIKMASDFLSNLLGDCRKVGWLFLLIWGLYGGIIP